MSADAPGTPDVAIISEQLARHFVGNPIGQRFAMGGEPIEVVGVAADSRYARITESRRWRSRPASRWRANACWPA